MQKNALKHISVAEAIYKPDDNTNDSWEWETGKEKESLEWLL